MRRNHPTAGAITGSRADIQLRKSGTVLRVSECVRVCARVTDAGVGWKGGGFGTPFSRCSTPAVPGCGTPPRE